MAKTETVTYGENFGDGSYEYAGLRYKNPKVILLNSAGIGLGELAARTCYDSFDSSEDEAIRNFGVCVEKGEIDETIIEKAKNIDKSNLLYDLSWTYFHHSILEHMNYTFYISDTSRSVLQEQSRHRLQSLSVRSTRYTMQPLLNAFVASTAFTDRGNKESLDVFLELVKELDVFVITNEDYVELTIKNIFDKLILQYTKLENGHLDLMLSKDARYNLANMSIEDKKDYRKIYSVLNNSKNKRNVGDSFKHIVDDNWKVDMVITFNLRSLKNYLDLRNSGAAYFQIRKLAEEIEECLPENVLELINKKYKRK